MPDTPRSTADARRTTVVAKAVSVFGRGGYHATPVTDVADAAGISQAYVLRLFGGKLGLFAAALDRCYLLIREALTTGAEQASTGTSAEILETMGDAYAALIADRDLLMLQIHAQSASDIPEIREATRRGYASVVELAKELSGGTDAEVQHFIALGQLCHLIVAAGLDDVDANWARTLTNGMRHP
ncbi:TetR/AcrR family transcriptional regulator [Umezawaea sp. Da 62-37]|uniref:TetR/AcrR family transcriptional regulator n=1 Tax=Umezawaea sp. Da 62-37 TaxID=3075927 RepID=UPI0028F70866|nr:TetR/AcrR family transcriptional regulator [Umezawaea sp. Da 62-37]WNV84019.1 TetR/AcrR family transcriptional regulator [Umezawaea sp. Da 62-37]